MRKTIRLLCITAIFVAGHQVGAQTVSTREQCYAAADRQLDECTGWGHNPTMCGNTWQIVMEMCDQQYPS